MIVFTIVSPSQMNGTTMPGVFHPDDQDSLIRILVMIVMFPHVKEIAVVDVYKRTLSLHRDSRSTIALFQDPMKNHIKISRKARPFGRHISN